MKLTTLTSRLRPVRAVAVAAVLALALAGCSDTTSEGSAGSGSDSDAAAAAETANANLEKSFAGTDRALPTSSPAIVKDQNVWIISCGQTAEGCASGARGAIEAGEKLGWKMTLVDGKFSVQTWNSGLRQAIADKADAIMLDIVDCGPVKGGLKEAKKAGIKIYAWYSFDCDDTDPNAEPLFDSQVYYGEDFASFADWLRGYGGSMADYVIAKTDGKAKVIKFTHEELRVVHYLVEGFQQRMDECKSCEVLVTQDITLADLGTTLQQKTATLLSRYPQANAVEGMYDSAISLGIGAAVMASGRNDDLIVTGGEGFGPNVGLIRDNKGQDFYAGSASTWVGWAAVDGLNRLLNGEDQVDAGIGWQSADKEDNLPAENVSYDGNIKDGKPINDYRANYLKIWGIN